jgi:hypothetical protein
MPHTPRPVSSLSIVRTSPHGKRRRHSRSDWRERSRDIQARSIELREHRSELRKRTSGGAISASSHARRLKNLRSSRLLSSRSLGLLAARRLLF